ncbi:MAG TPA: CmcJ/NvfI family oxidoreductase [Stellaceae bacterium]|nr:CmcJ/NvfI family oxidoreductase [Stellaceae bacterium]
MAEIAELDAPETLQAELNYYVDTGDKPVSLVAAPGGVDTRLGGGQNAAHRVTLRNGRLHLKEFDLDRNGFVFVPHPTKMRDFYDDDEVRRVYYPEMEELIKREASARRVVVFDHTLRTQDEAQRATRQIRDVVRRVHNDYTELSARKRVRDIMGGEAGELLKHRFAIVQTWRPIRLPVESWPLAIADSRTLDERNMVVTERRYQDRVGQTMAITWDPNHRWYWFPHMRRDEVLVFKVFDSETDGRSRWTAHTAFDDPTSPPNPRFRESIEIRTLAFF